ncbi:MAG: hypothetical protein AAF289_09750 [Cyanobacteria bacterium P01_A01_bin.135]
MSSPLPPDDRPPVSLSDLDVTIRRQLELSVSKHFFEACDGVTQSVLMECGWTVRTAEALMLVVHCPDATTNWRVLNRVTKIADVLARFSKLAKVRVYPPSGTGDPFDMRVNERSEFRDRP